MLLSFLSLNWSSDFRGSFMRRKSTGPKQAANSFDVLRDIEPAKLQTFAAILIVWNYIETFVDASLGYATKIHPDLFPHVSSRINGIDEDRHLQRSNPVGRS